MPAPREREDVLAVDVAAEARTHSSHMMQRLKSSSTSGCEASTSRAGKKCSKCGRQHFEVVGQRLQLAVAALFAARAEVIALDEQHLQQRRAGSVELRRVASPPPARHAPGCVQAASRAAVDHHRAQLAAAVRLELRVVAQVRDEDAGRQRRLQDRSRRRSKCTAWPSRRKLSCSCACSLHRSPSLSRVATRCASASSRPVDRAGARERRVEIEGRLEVDVDAAASRSPPGTACDRVDAAHCRRSARARSG